MGGSRKSLRAFSLPEGRHLALHLPRGGGYNLGLRCQFSFQLICVAKQMCPVMTLSKGVGKGYLMGYEEFESILSTGRQAPGGFIDSYVCCRL